MIFDLIFRWFLMIFQMIFDWIFDSVFFVRGARALRARSARPSARGNQQTSNQPQQPTRQQPTTTNRTKIKKMKKKREKREEKKKKCCVWLANLCYYAAWLKPHFSHAPFYRPKIHTNYLRASRSRRAGWEALRMVSLGYVCDRLVEVSKRSAVFPRGSIDARRRRAHVRATAWR